MPVFRILLLSLILLNNSCSQIDFQQLGFFVVQNLGELHCQKAMMNGCASRVSYDEYQRQRQEAEKKL